MRGLSLLDAKHRFVFSPCGNCPFRRRQGLPGKWPTAGKCPAVITYRSGFPIRVQNQNDAELQSSFFFEDANTHVSRGRFSS